MSRPRSFTTDRLGGLVAPIGLLVLVLVLVVPPARAGIGDMMRKAKDKATQAVTKKAPEAAPTEVAPGDEGKVTFDDATLELTGDRLDQILAAFDATKAAGAPRADLVAKLEKVNRERETMWDKNQGAIEAARNKRDDVQSCYHDGYRAAADRRAEEYKNRALSDPALREKFTKAAAQYNEAAARGDSTAIAKLQQILQGEMLPTREDSMKVREKCGALPPRLPAEAKVEDLDHQIASLNDQIRAVDDKIADAQAKQGGLDRKQWAIALERIQSYLSWKNSHGGSGSNGSGGSGDARKSKGSKGAGASSGSSGSNSAGDTVWLKRSFSDVEVQAMDQRLEKLRVALSS